MAEKKFGVRDLEIIDPTGTPTIESSGDLIVNAGGATERVRIKSDSQLLHTRSDNTTRYDLEFRQTGAITDGNYGGIHWTQSSTGSTNLAAIEIEYATNGRPDIVFKTRQSTGTSISEAVRINRSGNLAFPSGQGIDFSATGGPSDGADTSELLNDYEEGTFTPLFGSSITNPTYTTSSADGFYTKIGNQVTCWGLIVVNGTPTNGSGNWYITSFPYVSANISYRQNGIIGYNDVLTNEVNKLYIAGGASYCQIIPNGVTQSNETYNTNPITTGYFSFTITYRI